MGRLTVEGLTFIYTMARTRQELVALQGIDLTADRGEFVALVGPSGCGKSTLLNIIAGLLPAQHGRISLDDRPIRAPGPERAMVFQAPSLLPWRTVLGNVIYGLELQGMPRRVAHQHAREYIALVGLDGFADSYPSELSGGMQQRVNLARALAVQPEVLLCDEPLAALDAQTREYMQAELQRIWLERPMTTIYVTHNIAEAIFLADRVLVLSASPGRIKAEVTVDLPRPRPLSIERTAAFIQYEEQIWSLLDRPAQFYDARPAAAHDLDASS